MPITSFENLMKRKKEAKKLFCESLNIKYSKPLLGVVLDKELTKDEESNLKNILQGIAHVDMNVVILSDHSKISDVNHLQYNRKNRQDLLESADMSLSFSFSDVEEMLLHGTIPVSCARPEVSDYNPNRETGNSFIYKENDQWCIFAALVRALETYKFPYDWKNIVKQGLESVLV